MNTKDLNKMLGARRCRGAFDDRRCMGLNGHQGAHWAWEADREHPTVWLRSTHLVKPIQEIKEE